MNGMSAWRPASWPRWMTADRDGGRRPAFPVLFPGRHRDPPRHRWGAAVIPAAVADSWLFWLAIPRQRLGGHCDQRAHLRGRAARGDPDGGGDRLLPAKGAAHAPAVPRALCTPGPSAAGSSLITRPTG